MVIRNRCFRRVIMKAKRARENVEDYELIGWGNKRVRLSSLFGEKDELILIHNMGRGCPYCTMWADGFNGVLPHLEDRAAFAVVSPDPPSVQQKFATGRGWRFQMFSSKGTPFSTDMGYEKRNGMKVPGVSVFKRDKNGKIFRISKDVFGPGDDYNVVWHFFDLLPGGSKGWEPQFTYR